MNIRCTEYKYGGISTHPGHILFNVPSNWTHLKNVRTEQNSNSIQMLECDPHVYCFMYAQHRPNWNQFPARNEKAEACHYSYQNSASIVLKQTLIVHSVNAGHHWPALAQYWPTRYGKIQQTSHSLSSRIIWKSVRWATAQCQWFACCQQFCKTNSPIFVFQQPTSWLIFITLAPHPTK